MPLRLPHARTCPPAARAAVTFAYAVATLAGTGLPARAATSPPGWPHPAWLALAPGVAARVDIAPWLDSDEPEAALVASAASIERDFTASAARPADVVYEPIGTRVRIVRVLAGGRVVLVRGRDARFEAYTLVERLVPDVPPGTVLRAAGGFQGFSDFFAAIDTPYARAERLETGSTVVAETTAAAPYDPQTSDLVRVRVRVTGGNLRGRTGWIAIVYTGLPATRLPPQAAVAEKACRCRIVAFGSAS